MRVLVTDVCKHIVRMFGEKPRGATGHKPFEVLSDDTPIEEALARLLKKEDRPQWLILLSYPVY